MITTPEAHYITRYGDTVDYICWRHYGVDRQGLPELVLAANIGLAERGPVFPAGIPVTLPAVTTPEETEKVIELWD